MKKVPLDMIHTQAGARMAPFGGWKMPIQYNSGILEEHRHTREQVSIFDCSHMGQFRVRGRKAAQDLDNLFPRRASTQKNNSCRYNFLLTSHGTICDDLIIYRVSDDEFYIVVNAGTIDSDAEYIRSHLSPTTKLSDESRDTAKLDVQGPRSGDVIIKSGVPADKIPRYFNFIHHEICGVQCIVSRTGYTGELGFEIYFDATAAEKLWNYFTGQTEVKPAGLGARDTLRLEMGYPLYGHELNRDTTPVEAGFGSLLNLDHNFVGRDAQLVTPSKNLVAIQFTDRRAAREGAQILDNAGNHIGKVTSGSFSPSLGCAIAMGYVQNGLDKVGNTVEVSAGTKHITGRIVSVPFYKNGTCRQ